jgi:tetratricopeptide (TPR) repeat protein
MLTFATIVKNEANTIEQTIEHLRPYVDAVVIGVDTQSSDDTREIVERLADKVVDIHLSEELAAKASVDDDPEWGFSKARNYVASFCDPESWLLTIDGHERFQRPELIPSALQGAITAGCDAIEVTMYWEPDSNGIPQTSHKNIKLMAPEVKYFNSIHNYPKAQNVLQAHQIIVEHLRQEQDKAAAEERKNQRKRANVEGFEKKLKENPRDARSWFYLGTAYKENGSFNKALHPFFKCLEFSKWREERWHCRANLGLCYSCLNKNDKAREQFLLAIKEYPAMAEAYYYLGDLAYNQKNYHEAVIWLERCAQMGIPHCKLFVNLKVYMVSRYDCLSMTYNHLHQFGRAIQYAKKALEAGPNKRIEKNIQIWRKEIESQGGERYDGDWTKKTDISAIEATRMSEMSTALGPVRKVLDFGSGPGHMLQFLHPDAQYTGVDLSEVARNAVVDRGGRAVSSLSELNGDIFDGCILGEVLEHMEDDVALLREVATHLRKGSTIIASVPRYAVMYDPAHTRDYTETEFQQLMTTVGEAELLEPVGPWMLCKSVVR